MFFILRNFTSVAFIGALFLGLSPASSLAQVPGLINYQGRVAVGRADFEGRGNFKLALVNAEGTQWYWSNDADANSDGEPDRAVPLTVSRGLFSVQLGDTTLQNMAPLGLGVFTNGAVYLRVWFDDGVSGSQRLVPDQRIAAVGYAMMAANVADRAVTPEKLSPSALAVIGALSNRINAVEAALPSGLTFASAEAQSDPLVSRGFQVFTSIAAPAWVAGPNADAPSARYGQSGIWTGQEFVIWGGAFGSGLYSGSGAMFRPNLNQWRATSGDAAPAARSGHTAVWTGQEMIVWGGFSADGYSRSGARFQPSSQTWVATSLTGAPTARDGHAAVWIGNRMLIWGGRNAEGALGDCFFYDPVANQWASTVLTGGPSPRFGATVVWTGSRLIVWGGQGSGGTLNTGAQLLFENGVPAQWSPLNVANAPSDRMGHTVVWTGQRMIVWGGQRNGASVGDGGIYDPNSNAWEPVPLTAAPAARSGHNAEWTGQEMIIVAGDTAFGPAASGAAFNLASGKWRALSTEGNPQPRAGATTAWTGTELLVFGGRNGSQPIGALDRLNPQPTWYLYRKP